jgi:hypothetical protein
VQCSAVQCSAVQCSAVQVAGGHWSVGKLNPQRGGAYLPYGGKVGAGCIYTVYMQCSAVYSVYYTLYTIYSIQCILHCTALCVLHCDPQEYFEEQYEVLCFKSAVDLCQEC